MRLPPGDWTPARWLARQLGLRGPSLARASRDGRGPAGRRLLTGTVAVYPRAEVERWLAEREAGSETRLEAARARAAHAREVRAARRAGAEGAGS